MSDYGAFVAELKRLEADGVFDDLYVVDVYHPDAPGGLFKGLRNTARLFVDEQPAIRLSDGRRLEFNSESKARK